MIQPFVFALLGKKMDFRNEVGEVWSGCSPLKTCATIGPPPAIAPQIKRL